MAKNIRSKNGSSSQRKTGKYTGKPAYQKKNSYSNRSSKKEPEKKYKATSSESDQIRLNKYIANAGICSRRDADILIESGTIKVNGKIVTELGTKIKPNDIVEYAGERLNSEKKVYLLLNKPKGYITTLDDPFKRKTVMMLVQNACKERIIPVGRLDRNTTGLLLFTNDGDLAKKLTHPKYRIKKIYHIGLDKSISKQDLQKIASGIELDDGFIKVDKINWIGDLPDKKQLGLELHSGRTRIVRRIFESLDYKVIKLDRVFFAGLTKKDIPRGKWRFLTQEEINILHRIG